LRFYAPRVGVGLRDTVASITNLKTPLSIPPYWDCPVWGDRNPVYPVIDPMNRGITALERTPYAVLT